MPIQPPEPGDVIRYAYLWRDQAAAGLSEATKDRPCAIILATRREGEKTIVVVAPITHTRPREPRFGIELPPGVKMRLGLDLERSWVVTNDLNYFTWPGPDVRPLATPRSGRGFVYGQLPRSLTNALIANVRERLLEGIGTMTSRNDDAPPRKR